jgi:hypothetical protein
VALGDDVERLTRVLVRMHVHDGLAGRLRLASGREASAIGKLAGATAEAVFAWERGQLQPSTAQALAWLDALHAHRAPAERTPAPEKARANGG